MYKGSTMNKLQDGIILLIFNIWKIRNIGFVRNLILSNTSCEFYYNDASVASFVNDKYGDVTVKSIPSEILYCYSFSVGKRTTPQTKTSWYVNFLLWQLMHKSDESSTANQLTLRSFSLNGYCVVHSCLHGCNFCNQYCCYVTEIHHCSWSECNTHQTLNLVLFCWKSSSLAQQPATQLKITICQMLTITVSTGNHHRTGNYN